MSLYGGYLVYKPDTNNMKKDEGVILGNQENGSHRQSWKRKGRNLLLAFLLLSLGVHLFLILGVSFFNPDSSPNFDSATPIEITYETDSKNSNKIQKQFVTDPDLGALAEKLKEQSQRLSKFNRRVKEESIASRSGPTKNVLPTQPQNFVSDLKEINKTKAEDKKNNSGNQKDAFKFEKSDEGLDFRAETKKQVEAERGRQVPFSNSTIAEHIPNVKRGGFTVLNTDQFTYYSFFNRVNEQIRMRWTGKIRRVSNSLHPKIINQLALLGRETRVELVLSKTGDFVSVFVDQTSGAEILDRAATDALIEATPFLNPPLDLVDTDGFIRLNYSFFVEWQGRQLARQ
jgi:protein TonB